MGHRSLLNLGGAAVLGALAIGAVASGITPALAAPGDRPSPGYVPMPDPAEGNVVSPPFPKHLTHEERSHLEKFDEMDFVIYSNQEWSRLGESHAPNVRCHWPDGHYTDGIETHIADLSETFVWVPDTHVTAHPVRIAKDNLSAVTGVLKGTFTRPMPDGKGGFIAPTGKAWAIDVVTVGIWNRQGTMDEEFLFWDNQSFFAKLGLA
jgi:hypothetical protein